MRVLHFIPRFADVVKSAGFQYKLTLIKVMAENADVHLLCGDYPNINMDNVNVHKFSPLRNVFGGKVSTFDRFLSEIHPDIVHIHACWSFYAYRFLKRCEKFRIPTIITFDRRLEVWHISYRYWLFKFPQAIFYQRYCVSHAKALQAVCEGEVSSISDFVGLPKCLNKAVRLKLEQNCEKHCICESNDCGEKWKYDIYSVKLNGKIRHIFNINVYGSDKDASFKIMSEKLLNMYQVVIDSNPFLLMKADDRSVEDILLHAGLVGDIKRLKLSNEFKQLLYSLSSESCRRILLHSLDEGILETVLIGLKLYNIPLPFSKEKINEIYCLPKLKEQNDVKCRQISNLKTDTSIQEAERNICIKLITVLYSIKKNKYIRRVDLVELFCSLRYNNYDEVLLYNKVCEFNLSKDTARLFQIMKERYGLGDGFMFIEPLADKGTQKMRKMLFKANIQ